MEKKNNRKILEYFTCENKEHWLREIQKSDWGAGQYLYSLLKENKLYSYLVEFDCQARDTLILPEEQMRHAEGITEELKRQDQLEWVCRMNNIRSRAEEIVTEELVYE